jgi:hypothetical protein
VPDGCELGGAIADCNGNAIADGCDVSGGTSLDKDANGVPDECEACLVGPAPVAASTMQDAGSGRAVRYLGVQSLGGVNGQRQAMRVTFDSLPAPFNSLNGGGMWVTPPVETSENAGNTDPAAAPGFPRFWAATLGCTPAYVDWAGLGPVYISHAAIVPGGQYRIELVVESCDANEPGHYTLPLAVTNSGWADVVGHCGVPGCTPPDGDVDLVSDVVGALDKFGNRPGAPIKARVDVEPAVADRLLNITDVSRIIDAFRGVRYPFAAVPAACP